MSHFKFRLQRVLDIKVKDEEDTKIMYSKAQNNKQIVEKELENLQYNYDKYSDISGMKDLVTQKITANYLNSLSYSIEKTNEELQKKQEELQEVREELLSKQIERKSLEKLREDKLSIHKKEEAYKEQAINDEFAIYSYIRNKVHVV